MMTVTPFRSCRGTDLLLRAWVVWNQLAPAGGLCCMENNLTGKQRLFVQAYLAYGEPTFLNATQSAKRAGYSGSNEALAVRGHRLVRKANIRSHVNAWFHEQGYNANDLIRRWLTVVQTDLSRYITSDSGLDLEGLKGAGLGFLIKGVRYSAKGKTIYDLRDPEKAEEQLAKAMGMFVERKEVELAVTGEIDVSWKNAGKRIYGGEDDQQE